MAYVAARLGAEVAGRLKQPLVVGEILAGVLIGPAVLGWIPKESVGLDAMAELGVIFLLFSVGLETELSDLRRVGGRAISVAVGGMLVPFILGAGMLLLIGGGTPKALFAGAALSATSVGITARVLRDKNALASKEARVILGAAVFDDVLTLLLLTAVTAVVAGKAGLASLLGLAFYAFMFVLLLTTFGRRLVVRISPRVPSFKSDEPGFGWAIALALVLAVAAASIGLAAIIGAFIAGVIMAEVADEHELKKKILPLTVFFVPFFFVKVGTLLEIDALLLKQTLLLSLAITALAIVGKLVGAGIPALSMGKPSAAIVAAGMVPRGEVGIIVASLGLAAGVIDEGLYAVFVIMSIATTLIAPPALSYLIDKRSNSPT
ncbi:MAG TPA: cation:proton antiporter [Actinomycetota bacterium]|nr:cation:proton antiporter [Actinomycetota bacterium]